MVWNARGLSRRVKSTWVSALKMMGSSLWAVKNFRTDERPRPDGAPLLKVENITAKYHSFKALDDVSFDVPEGRTVAIVGESGSGKSTMARVIMPSYVLSPVTWR